MRSASALKNETATRAKGLLFIMIAFWLFGATDVSPQVPHEEHLPGTGEKEAVRDMEIRMGEMIYSMSCVYCHGSKGRGDGAASIFIGPFSHPRPNDFTRGVFKFRSTESGTLPTLSDLMRTIREGIPGFMPSFRNLGEEGIRQVALYVAARFIKEDLPTKTTIKYIEHVGPYTYTVESVRRGRQLYQELGCFICHGEDGRGGKIALHDERGLSIKPVDLTRQETFGNGTSHEDIYRTIMTGLDGTPMPGFSPLFREREESAWDLVHYILSLQGR